MQKLAELGQLTRENVAIIAKYTGADSGLLREALTQSMLAALHDVEPSLRQAAIAGFLTPAEHPPELSPGASQAVESYYRQAADKLNLVNTVMLQSSLNQYRKAVADTTAYEAQLSAAQSILNSAAGEVIVGASTHTQAVRRAVRRMAEEGLTGFIDRGGHRWTPEAYVSMDVQTTMTNTAHAAVWARNEEYGNDLILVSTKAAARPKCYPWQNKVLSRTDSTRDVQDLHGNTVHAYAMSETSYGQPDGLFGINCHHFSSPFIPGFSHLGGDPEPEDVNREQYAQSQKQRALEREVRYAKREAAMLDAAGDREAFEKAAMKVKRKQAALKTFANETGRTLRSDRTQVLGYNRSVAGKAVVAAKRAERIAAINKAIENSGDPKKLVGNPDELLKRTSPVDTPKIKGVIPKGTLLTNVEVQAGYGTSTPIRDLARLYAQNPKLDPQKWQKKSGKAKTDYCTYTVHWYENQGFVPPEDVKTKGLRPNESTLSGEKFRR